MFSCFSHAHQLETSQEENFTGFLRPLLGERVSRVPPTGTENRFENNQNKKHYHFTIRRTQTRCLMNRATISSDISACLCCKSSGKKSETRKSRHRMWGSREKQFLQLQDSSLASLRMETSNFPYKMKSSWKYEKYDKQIGIFMYFTSEIV